MVLIGVCVEELRAPFGAVTEAVSGYLADISGRLSEVVGPDGGVLAALLPSLSDRLPSVAGDLDPRGATPAPGRCVAAHNGPRCAGTADGRGVGGSPLGGPDRNRPAGAAGHRPSRCTTGDRRHLPNTETSPRHSLFGLVSLAGNHTHLVRIHLVGLDVTHAAEFYRHFGGTTADSRTFSSCESSADNALYLSSLLRELAAGPPADGFPRHHDLIAHRTASGPVRP